MWKAGQSGRGSQAGQQQPRPHSHPSSPPPSYQGGYCPSHDEATRSIYSQHARHQLLQHPQHSLLQLARFLSQRPTSHAHPFTMIGAPPSPIINPPPSNPSSLVSASPRSPRMTLPPMDRTSSTSSAVSSASTSQVTLHLISQFTYPQGTPEDRTPPSVIRAKRSHTIVKIKNAVHINWPGRPKVEGIRLIHSGRVLLDHETVGQVVAEGQSEVSCYRMGRP